MFISVEELKNNIRACRWNTNIIMLMMNCTNTYGHRYIQYVYTNGCLYIVNLAKDKAAIATAVKLYFKHSCCFVDSKTVDRK